MIAGAIAGKEVTINRVRSDHLTAVTDTLRACGYVVGGTNGTLTIRANGIPEPLDLKTRPYPGFPTDLQAQTCALLSTAAGESSVTEDIFPQRFMHVSELKRMGAKIELDGATAKIRGVDNLSGAPVMASDLRASAALILAGLLADGMTEINRVYHIDRGYEMIDQKLGELGAHIERANGLGRGVSRLFTHKQIKRPILRSYLCPGMLRATELNREPEKDALML